MKPASDAAATKLVLNPGAQAHDLTKLANDRKRNRDPMGPSNDKSISVNERNGEGENLFSHIFRNQLGIGDIGSKYSQRCQADSAVL